MKEVIIEMLKLVKSREVAMVTVVWMVDKVVGSKDNAHNILRLVTGNLLQREYWVKLCGYGG